MFRKFLFVLSISLLSCAAYSESGLKLNDRYKPDTYTKYDIELKKENIKVTIFKINRDEPHLNPMYFDVYFQCGKGKSYYKLKRNFGAYKSEQTYCDSEKPVVQKIEEKLYLAIPLKLADPEIGCPTKVNRKEIFSTEQMKKHCDAVSVN